MHKDIDLGLQWIHRTGERKHNFRKAGLVDNP